MGHGFKVGDRILIGSCKGRVIGLVSDDGLRVRYDSDTGTTQEAVVYVRRLDSE